jgi:hypothetical protein
MARIRMQRHALFQLLNSWLPKSEEFMSHSHQLQRARFARICCADFSASAHLPDNAMRHTDIALMVKRTRMRQHTLPSQNICHQYNCMFALIQQISMMYATAALMMYFLATAVRTHDVFALLGALLHA